MYSEKLEEVISAALADGNLTEQKRKIIMRRAEKEGEDVEEVMMVVESRLLNQTKKQSNQSQSKSESKEEVTNGDFVETVNGVSFKMIKVEGGRFTMFSMSLDACMPAKPKEVILDDYFICNTVVTQELWKAVMGRDFPLLSFVGDKLPVNNLTWEESYQFINKLSAFTNKNYRGGNKSRGYKYAGSNTIGDVAWYYDNSGRQTHPVKTKRANELGLYDMSGNCYEFCEDNLVENPILNGSKNPIVRTTPKGFRIVRNTPFDSYVISVGDRNWCPCDRRQNGYGFRLAL